MTTIGRAVRGPRLLGLLDQLLFAGWSMLLVVLASRVVSTAEFGRFSVLYLIVVTVVQVARPVVGEPMIFLRAADGRILGGGVVLCASIATILLPIASGLALIGFSAPLACAVVASAIAQDSMRMLAVARDRLSAALLGDGVCALAVCAALVYPSDRWSPASLAGFWLAALVFASVVIAAGVGTGEIAWSIRTWTRLSASFARGATLGSSIDVIAVTACFALPAVLGRSSLTAALTAGRTFYAVPITVVASWASAWSWRYGRVDRVSAAAARWLLGVCGLVVVAWAALGVAIASRHLGLAFGGVAVELRPLLIPLGVFNAVVALSLGCKAVLRAARRPGDARHAAWVSDGLFIAAALALSGTGSEQFVWSVTAASLPLLAGNLWAVVRVVRGSPGDDVPAPWPSRPAMVGLRAHHTV